MSGAIYLWLVNSEQFSCARLVGKWLWIVGRPNCFHDEGVRVTDRLFRSQKDIFLLFISFSVQSYATNVLYQKKTVRCKLPVHVGVAEAVAVTVTATIGNVENTTTW